jgi:hypothetical protein
MPNAVEMQQKCFVERFYRVGIGKINRVGLVSIGKDKSFEFG